MNIPVYFFIILVIAGFAFVYFLKRRLNSFNEELSWICDNYSNISLKCDHDQLINPELKKSE